jgi:hypothetical protein
MLKGLLTSLVFSVAFLTQAQTPALTVEKIMRDPKWIGTSPTLHQWSADGKMIYFNWDPDNALDDSVYYITPGNKTPVKASVAEKQDRINANAA